MSKPNKRKIYPLELTPEGQAEFEQVVNRLASHVPGGDASVVNRSGLLRVLVGLGMRAFWDEQRRG